jgi:hypothetical protein
MIAKVGAVAFNQFTVADPGFRGADGGKALV